MHRWVGVAQAGTRALSEFNSKFGFQKVFGTEKHSAGAESSAAAGGCMAAADFPTHHTA